MRAIITVAAVLGCSVLALNPGQAQQQWGRNYFPNVPLTTQDGKKIRFYDDVLKGKVVAVNFIYTSCGDVCPLDTAALRRVQKLVGNRMGRDVFFYSISVDPKTDTPAVLKKYMKTFDVGPGWTFLTGRAEDIALIQRKFGIRPVSPSNLSAHDTRFVLGNEAIARWVKRTPHDNPHVLAHILTRDLPAGGKGRDNRQRASFAQAEQVKGMTGGETLFMTRCSACHSLGGGDGRLGPDLAGVTDKRPRTWLMRRIKEPDKMRAAKDPATMAVAAKYPNMAMPNLKLSDTEVADIIGYLAQEDRRKRSLTTKPHSHTHEHRQ
ncbi:SCO family protein [Sphingomonas sp. GCM10030256]|uniref:SCO family protein n=1 Tax=Sphingomonas sp. GCM10030256 TaxID=3273427 RepID=UPI00361EC935